MLRSWIVKGVVFVTKPQKETGMLPKKFVVRYQRDTLGESLSIADEKSGVMFQVPFKEIRKAIGGDT